jgi:hypothetical protein
MAAADLVLFLAGSFMMEGTIGAQRLSIASGRLYRAGYVPASPGVMRQRCHFQRFMAVIRQC